MVVKDVDSVMTCGAVPSQMLKGEKHFANTVASNTGLSNQSHSSHFQIKTGSAFIAQLVRASHQHCKVTGSNPVEVLTFFRLLDTQLHKLHS